MDAKKCDRCKKYYDKYVGLHKCSNDGNVYQNYEIPYNRLVVCNSIYKQTVPNNSLDLCPECMQAFDKWLKEKGE